MHEPEPSSRKESPTDLRARAVLWNADDLAMTLRYRAAEAGARTVGVSIQPLGVRAPADFAEA